MKQGKYERVLPRKLGFAALILMIYMSGRQIPLFAIDESWYRQLSHGVEQILGMTVSGDAYRTSIFALGISPYMLSSILIMAVTAIRRAVTRSKFSSDRMKHLLYASTLVLSVFQAISMVIPMHFHPTDLPLNTVRAIAAAQLVAGAMFIVWLLEVNKEHGIGGQSIIITVNLVDSVFTMLLGVAPAALPIPLLCALAAIGVALVMENAEFRIPVQRIFIHNIYKDKNYIAIKYNPVGMLPAMFSASVFMLLQQLFSLIARLLPGVPMLTTFANRFVLHDYLGVAAYIIITYILTITFSLILVSPSEMTEQLLKNNDSICGVCSGKATRRYLFRIIFSISLLSSTVMSLCIGAALVLQVRGNLDSSLVMLPSIAMMLTSILVNLTREFRTAVSFERYRVFL